MAFHHAMAYRALSSPSGVTVDTDLGCVQGIEFGGDHIAMSAIAKPIPVVAYEDGGSPVSHPTNRAQMLRVLT